VRCCGQGQRRHGFKLACLRIGSDLVPPLTSAGGTKLTLDTPIERSSPNRRAKRCSTVANLLVARGSARRKEVAIRTALGRTKRLALIREQLTESLLICVAGGVIAWGCRSRRRG